MEEEEEVRSSEAAETFANQTFHSFQYFHWQEVRFSFLFTRFFFPSRNRDWKQKGQENGTRIKSKSFRASPESSGESEHPSSWSQDQPYLLRHY